MPDPIPDTSLRFTRAASAERKRLARKLSRLLEKREEHERAIEDIELSAKTIEDRIRLLGDLVSEDGPSSEPAELRAADPNGKKILRGASIREVAVPLLLQEAGESPVHYRHWYELLERAGYEVLGKRPDAVFLNQVARSPLVKASTQPGIYSLDLDAIERLRAALEGQQDKLARDGADDVPRDAGDFQESVERHHELVTSVAKLRRELDEALRAIEAGQNGTAPMAHAA